MADQRDQAPRLLFVANVSFSFIHNRLALAQAAQAAGYEVHVATRVWRAEDQERIQAAGMQLHPIDIGRGDSGLLYDLRSLGICVACIGGCNRTSYTT